jgi:hypothetical protein
MAVPGSLPERDPRLAARSGVEQARLSTICSARAEFADFAPRLAFVRMQNAIRNASLFSCQRSLRPETPDRPAPGGTLTPSTTRQSNKKPGVERRAKPSAYNRTGSRDARLICYPEFVIDLTCDRSLVTLNAPDNHSTTTAIRQTNGEYIRIFSLVKRSFSQV